MSGRARDSRAAILRTHFRAVACGMAAPADAAAGEIVPARGAGAEHGARGTPRRRPARRVVLHPTPGVSA